MRILSIVLFSLYSILLIQNVGIRHITRLYIYIYIDFFIIIDAVVFVFLSATRGKLHTYCVSGLSLRARVSAQARNWTSCVAGGVVFIHAAQNLVCCIF